MSSAGEQHTIEAELEQLCFEASRDQELIAAGRIDELSELLVRRHEAFDRLSRQAGPVQRGSHAYRQLVAQLHEHGARTVALLSSIRDEMADEIGQGRHVRQAAGRYASSTRL